MSRDMKKSDRGNLQKLFDLMANSRPIDIVALVTSKMRN